jgi:hypothetical protein
LALFSASIFPLAVTNSPLVSGEIPFTFTAIAGSLLAAVSFFSFPLIMHSAKSLAFVAEGVTDYARSLPFFFQPTPAQGLHSPLLPPASP